MQRKPAAKDRYRQDMRRLANNLKRYRQQAHYSQVELAQRVRIHREYISLIERGSCNPSLRLLTYVAAGLGTEIKCLFENRCALKRKVTRQLTRRALRQRLLREYRRLATNIRKRRLSRGWSQNTFAHKTRTHYTFVSLIERRRTNPSLKVLSKIALGIRVKTEKLFSDCM